MEKEVNKITAKIATKDYMQKKANVKIKLDPEIIELYEKLRVSKSSEEWGRLGIAMASLLLTQLDRTYARNEILNGFINSLGPRNQKVIRMGFGIGYDRGHKLEEVAKEFSVTRERIRQLEIITIRYLRNSIKAAYKAKQTELFKLISKEDFCWNTCSGEDYLIRVLFDTPQMIEYLNEAKAEQVQE